MSDANTIEGKPFAGKISNWAIYDGSGRLRTPEDEAHFRKMTNGVSPLLFTGEVEEDLLGRWPDGSCMRSSALVSIDMDTWMVETERTIYQLQGPGRITRVAPGPYEFEVGKTIMMLNPIKDFTLSHETDDDLIFPDKPESLTAMVEVAKFIRQFCQHAGSNSEMNIPSEVQRTAEQIFGGREKADQWLNTPLLIFKDLSPIQVITQKDDGATQVLVTLRRIKSGELIS